MDKKNRRKTIIVAFIVIFFIIYSFVKSKSDNNTIEVNIGYQSITAQTWGALIIKNEKILENKLIEMNPDKKYKIIWHDELSGSAINNNMLSHKYELGYMGDMPCIINLYNSSVSENYSSILLSLDGIGISGMNQAIMVGIDTNISSPTDLIGKKISVPVGSSAHRMLLEALNKYNIEDTVSIIHQDIPTAISMLETGKIDAIAVWEPYQTYLSNNGKARLLCDGTQTGITYLAGIMADKDWMDDNYDVYSAFVECVKESHKYIEENPKRAASIIANESGFAEDVVEKVISNITWKENLTEEEITTLEGDYNFLRQIDNIGEFSFMDELKERERFVNE